MNQLYFIIGALMVTNILALIAIRVQEKKKDLARNKLNQIYNVIGSMKGESITKQCLVMYEIRDDLRDWQYENR